MAASLTSLSAVLKEFYLGPIQEQLNQEVNVFKLFDALSVEWAGKIAVIPVHLARNSAVRAVGENGTLPAAGQEGFDDLRVVAKYIYGRFQFSGPAMAASSKQIGSFGTITQLEMDKLVEDVKIYADLCMFTGGQGIGFVWQKQNGTTFEYSGRSAPFVGVGPGASVQLFRLDDYTAVGAPTQLNAISSTSLTVAANINTAAVPVGVPMLVLHNGFNAIGDTNVLPVEPTGLVGNLGLQSFFSIDRSQAVNASMRSNFRLADATNATYQPLALDGLQSVLDKITLASGQEPDIIWMNPLQRQSYTTLLQGTSAGNLFTTTRGEVGKGDAGFSGLGYNNIPIRTAQHCPTGSIFFMKQKTWKRCELKPGGFADNEGKILSKVPNQDAYEGFWNMYYETVCLRPNANGVLTAVETAV